MMVLNLKRRRCFCNYLIGEYIDAYDAHDSGSDDDDKIDIMMIFSVELLRAAKGFALFFTHFTIVLPRLNVIFYSTFHAVQKGFRIEKHPRCTSCVRFFILAPFCFGTDPLVPFRSFS